MLPKIFLRIFRTKIAIDWGPPALDTHNADPKSRLDKTPLDPSQVQLSVQGSRGGVGRFETSRLLAASSLSMLWGRPLSQIYAAEWAVPDYVVPNKNAARSR